MTENPLLPLYLRAYKIRKVEQTLFELFSRGLIKGTIHTCIGQEFTGIALGQYLSADDFMVSNHRCHGHYLSRFDDVRGLLAEIMGKTSGVCHGQGGSQHLYQQNFFSSGIQGGMTPTAAGMAWAYELQGKNHIATAFIGDGTLGQGIVYEVMNLAAVKKLPFLMVVEDNQYAQSTSQKETMSGSIEKRACAFDHKYFKSSTFDLEDLLSQSKKVVEYVRSERRPALLHIETYRLVPHSKGDDFRDPKEIESYRQKDLLTQFISNHQHVEKLAQIDSEVEQVVNELVDQKNSVSITMPSNDLNRPFESNAFNHAQVAVKEINLAFHQAFEKDSQLIFLGEDLLDPYGGAFKISKGLSDKYPKRVFNMPISEPTIVGVSTGLALGGFKVISEIMFGDFILLAMDQILNHGVKFKQMFGREISIPVVIRTPMGGRKGYGATHGQSLEKFLIGIPDLNLFILHPRMDYRIFYQNLLDSLSQVSVVIENKALYTYPNSQALPVGYQVYATGEKFPLTSIKNHQDPDITVISFGGVGIQVEEALVLMEQEEINLEIFYPLDLHTCNLRPILDSLEKSGRLLLVEEGTGGASLGSEFFERICRLDNFKRLKNYKLLTALNRPIPAGQEQELQVLPSTNKIAEALLELYDE